MKTQLYAVLLAASLLGACGGGSGGSNSEGYFSGDGEQASSSQLDFTNLSIAEMTQVPFSGSHASVQTGEGDASYLLILNAVNTLPGSYTVQLADEG
ncbi:MAG: hypothetical protein HYY44_01820, partial [Deltaproteobacteria bacterium]|nr:hypothetical protein [Deltaproteobacteria bacterium]